MQANKDKKNKVPVELVPPYFIISIAEVLEFGAKKYGAWNWLEGRPWTEISGAAMRHLYKWMQGEDIDKESGLPHLSHCVTNLMFLTIWQLNKKGQDTRIKKYKI